MKKFDENHLEEMIGASDSGEPELLFDWTTFDISFDTYFFEKNHPEHPQAKVIDKAWEVIYGQVAQKCNESGEYTIDCYKDRYTVVKTDELEKLRMERMTDEEREAYLANKHQQDIEKKRSERDHLLVTVVDPVVTNPLRWSELSAEEQDNYKAYRQYLLDVPQDQDFPDVEIQSFEEFFE